MTREELDNAIGGNEIATNHVTTSEVANIMMYVNVNLELDRKTMEHYYTIDVDELLNSKMPVSDLDDLINQGWAYNENRDKLIIFLTI
jgi:hypothetical protein